MMEGEKEEGGTTGGLGSSYKGRAPLPFFKLPKAQEALDQRDQEAYILAQSTISKEAMSGDNIERGIIKDLLYMILLRMGNGDVIEIMTMGLTLVERCEGKDFVAMRMIALKITKTHQEHQIFEDMIPMEDVREPPMEENSVNEIESQVSRNNEEEAEKSVRSQEEDM